MYFVYIIHSLKLDKYYIGFTSDLNDRLAKHNRNSKGFTNSGKPWVLVYYEPFENKHLAMSRKKHLKSWKNKERISALIKTGSEHPD